MLKTREKSYPYRKCCIGIYAAFDLHSSNSYWGIIDVNGKRVFRKKLKNDEGLIVKVLEPLKSGLKFLYILIHITLPISDSSRWLRNTYITRINTRETNE